ncbi:MAG: Mur ligase, partial [Gammaproteobacteria bacterium]|nr:Mur ligase [Gammaproteobacteria bacterium]
QTALAEGKTAIVYHESNIEIRTGSDSEILMPVSDIPTTLNGAAEHNVANAMGVTGLSLGLGVTTEFIKQGLANFKGDVNDNPGRGNYFDANGARVLIDFAHNPHSLAAIIKTVKALPAKRRLIMIGHAGDRTDRDIRNLTAVALKMEPDVVVTAEIPDYLRGRELYEITNLMRDECLKTGLTDEQVVYSESCLAGAEFALSWAQPGDFMLLLALDQRDKVFQLLQ